MRHVRQGIIENKDPWRAGGGLIAEDAMSRGPLATCEDLVLVYGTFHDSLKMATPRLSQ